MAKVDIEDRWQYAKVDIDLIDEAEMNANEMTAEDFAQLRENIGISGLSSTPTCYKTEAGRYVLISGHHRVRACKQLHFKRIGILFVDWSDLDSDERIAVQISHNSLHGSDNQNILKRLFAQIKSVEYKKFAHISIDEIKPISMDGIDVFALKETFTFAVVLYPNSFQSVDEIYGDIREQAKKSDALILADQGTNEELLLKLQTEVGKEWNIKSPSISFAKVLELAAERLIEIREDKEHDMGDSK